MKNIGILKVSLILTKYDFDVSFYQHDQGAGLTGKQFLVC